MAQPIWRKIVSELSVPEPQKQWKLALDAVTVGKLMMIEVVIAPGRNPPETGSWTPQDFVAACSADGDLSGEARGATTPTGTPLVSSAPLGALIARIGGSTADQTLDTSTTTPSRIVFSVGCRCVFTVPNSPTGSLYLGVNDDPSRMAHVAGHLLVNIHEAV
jgi:hypothetical protein